MGCKVTETDRKVIESAFKAQHGFDGVAEYRGYGRWQVTAQDMRLLGRTDEVTPWQGGIEPACCYCGETKTDLSFPFADDVCECLRRIRAWTVTDLGETWPRVASVYARFYFEEVR